MPSNLKQVDTHTFTDGIITTIARELLPPTAATYILNCNIHSQGEGNVGIITNVKGNTEIAFALPSGFNRCMGVANDEENNKFYFMVYNDNGNDSIFQYDALTKTVINILHDKEDTGGIQILRFSPEYLILHADVIKGRLYWVDGKENARKTNISKLIDKSATGYGTVLESYINAYKQTDPFAPTAIYFSDTTKKFNRLYGALYKFAVRFLYDDGEVSNWSDFSAVPLPAYEPFTGVNAIPTDNNALQISFGTGDKTVIKIEVAMQDTSAAVNDTSLLNWVLITTVNKKRLGLSDNTQYTYTFYNDIAAASLDQTKIIRPYSFLPKRPLCQAFVKNALVYSNAYEGFPVVDIDVSTSVTYSDLFIEDGVDNEFNDPYFNLTKGTADYVSSHEDITTVDGVNTFLSAKESPSRFVIHTIKIGSDVKAGNQFKLILSNGQSDNFNYTYTAINTDTYLTVANKVKQFLIGTGRIFRKTEELPETNIYNNTVTPDMVTFSYIIKATRNQNDISGSASVQPVQFNTLKDTGQSIRNIKLGSSIKLGIEYEDFDGRKSLVYTVDALIVNISTINELGGYKASKITVQINHKAPIWAKYYQIVRSSDLVYGTYIQMLIQKVVAVNDDEAQDYLDLVVGSLYTYQKIHPNTPLVYEFAKGDRLRAIRKTSDGTYYPSFETEIISYSATLTDDIFSNVTTNGSATVTVGEAKASNIGKFMLIDGNEREITDAPTSTTYLLNNTVGGTDPATYLSYKLIDRRGTVRIRKPSGITLEDNSMVEIYKPSSISNPLSTQQFFEFQKKFAIINAGTENAYHGGNKQNQTAVLPALVEISEGTAYVRNREQPLNNQFPGTQMTIQPVEDQSYSDFYESLMNDNGRVNAEDNGDGEVHFGSRMRFSNNFIEDTRINGLNDFDNLDREDYNDKYGDIMLTKFDTNLIYTFKQLKTSYVPVDARITQDNSGVALNVGSAKLLNPIQYFAWEGGIGNSPESYAANATQKYFISPNSGVIIRLGGNGEEPISKTYFLDNEVRELLTQAVNNKARIFGGFDRKNGVYVVTIEGYNKYIYFDGFNGWVISTPLLPDSTTFEIVAPSVNGTATLTSGFEITYQPNTDFVGNDSFTYRAFIDGAWSLPKKACITVVDVPQEKAWRQKELSYFCVTEDGLNTGYKGWATLEEYLVYDNSLTGEEKPNDVTDPDYVAPIFDTTACSIALTVPINWQIIYGADPFTWNALIVQRNGVETDRLAFAGAGTISGTYYEGDTIKIIQFSFPDVYPWAPSSKANLGIKLNNVTSLYNNDVTTQAIELQYFEYVIPVGATSVDIVSTGSSTAVGYTTKTLSTVNSLNEGDYGVKLDDNTTGNFILNVNPKNGNSFYPFNYLTDANLLTATLTNNISVGIPETITGEFAYSESGTIPVSGTIIENDIPKGTITITT